MSPIPTEPEPIPRQPPHAFGLQAVGGLLFLFIPVVLWLFVRHPAPIAASLAAGVALMLGHRFLARPYLRRALAWKCAWCNRVLPAAADPPSATLPLAAGGAILAARCCAGHRAHPARFFRFLAAARQPLRAGIFVPLLVLLAALGAAVAGHPRYLPGATALFQLLVGLTVSAAAWGYLVQRPDGGPRRPAPDSAAACVPDVPPALPAPIAVPFPVHNFFLLGLRALLWIFRLVGAWWIVRGASHFLA
jgi:hypothetical protein